MQDAAAPPAAHSLSAAFEPRRLARNCLQLLSAYCYCSCWCSSCRSTSCSPRRACCPTCCSACCACTMLSVPHACASAASTSRVLESPWRSAPCIPASADAPAGVGVPSMLHSSSASACAACASEMGAPTTAVVRLPAEEGCRGGPGAATACGAAKGAAGFAGGSRAAARSAGRIAEGAKGIAACGCAAAACVIPGSVLAGVPCRMSLGPAAATAA